jgi:hypothetical protein
VRPAGVKDLGETDDKTVSFRASNNFYYLPGQSFQAPKTKMVISDSTIASKDGKYAETPAKVTGNDVFSSSPGVNDWYETVKLNYGVDIQGGTTHFDTVPDME